MLPHIFITSLSQFVHTQNIELHYYNNKKEPELIHTAQGQSLITEIGLLLYKHSRRNEAIKKMHKSIST